MHKFPPTPKKNKIYAYTSQNWKKKFDLNVTKQNKQLPLVLGW